MIKERAEKQVIHLPTVTSVFYRIINSTSGIFEEERFGNLELAKEKASESNGQVVRISKLTEETWEMELVN